MSPRANKIFYSKWFFAFLAGGLLGWGASFLSGPLAFIGAGLGFCFFWGILEALDSRREKKLLEDWLAQSGNEGLLAALAPGSDPWQEALRFSLDRIRDLSQASAPLIETKSSSLQNFADSMERVIREQEKMAQDFGSFRDSIRDWAGTIEKAGRINRSILQLNELIVGDSKKVSHDTDEAARSATEGIKSVGKEIKAMTDIKATIGSSTEVIQQLSLASEQIGDFLATITTITRKTNLLALNAGIEAARAGEHGQGFAVVAGEIKILAEASAKASGDVKHLVDDIRSKTTSAIALISTTGKIEENVNVVYSAGDVFMTIVKSIRKAGGLLNEISQALDDQHNDNELLVQLIQKIALAGDQVRDRLALVEKDLNLVQKISKEVRLSLEKGSLEGAN